MSKRYPEGRFGPRKYLGNVPPGKVEPLIYVQITIKTPLGSEPS
jgi:hypothetical protein